MGPLAQLNLRNRANNKKVFGQEGKRKTLLHLSHPLRRLFGTPAGGRKGKGGGAASNQTLHLPHSPQWDQKQGEGGVVGGNRTLGKRKRRKKCTPGLLLCLSLSSLTPSQSVSPKQRHVSRHYREGMDRDREASHSFFVSFKVQSKFFVQAANKVGVLIRTAAVIPQIFPLQDLTTSNPPAAAAN